MTKNTCWHCDKRVATGDTIACVTCVKRWDKGWRPDPAAPHGAFSRHARSELDAYAKDVLQPINRHGTINKHFVQVHGTRAIEKEFKMTKEQVFGNVEKYG